MSAAMTTGAPLFEAVWIKPEAMMPDAEVTVMLALAGDDFAVVLGSTDGAEWFDQANNVVDVVAWMEMPRHPYDR